MCSSGMVCGCCIVLVVGGDPAAAARGPDLGPAFFPRCFPWPAIGEIRGWPGTGPETGACKWKETVNVWLLKLVVLKWLLSDHMSK